MSKEKTRPEQPATPIATQSAPPAPASAERTKIAAQSPRDKVMSLLRANGVMATYDPQSADGLQKLSRCAVGDAIKTWENIDKPIKVVDVTICQAERENQESGEVREVIELHLHDDSGAIFTTTSHWALMAYLQLCRLVGKTSLVGYSIKPVRIRNPSSGRERLSFVFTNPK